MGFNNPLTGQNGALIYQQIKSPNFSVGISGWKIAKDGSAEFNNLTIRGTFFGTNFIINSSGIFIYSGTPAAGNLILSLAGAAGVDSFGNTYSQGLTAGASGTAEKVVVGISGGAPLIYFLSAIGTALNNAALMLNISGAGTAAHDDLVIKSSQDNAHQSYVAINLNGNSNDGVTQLSSLAEAYVDAGGTPHFYRTMDFSGSDNTGFLVGVQPGTGTSDANVAVAETWHLAALGAGFTTGGADQAPRYRLEGIGGGVVRIDGTVYTSAAVLSGATMFTLPAGYRPTIRRRFAGVSNASGITLDGSTVVVATTGIVSIGVAANAAAQQICLDGMTFSVD
jgi:hypothetical protein